MFPQDLLYSSVPILQFIAIIVATWVVARFLGSLLERRLKQSPPLVTAHVRRLAWTATWVLGGLFALEQLGLRLDVVLLLVGLLGAALVVGNKDVLQNLASRYFHDVYVPFKVGDTIRIREQSGKVIEVNPITTVLMTDKQDLVSIPNALFLREVVVNTTPQAWKEVIVPIMMDNNADLAEFEKQILLSCNKLRTHLDERFPPVVSIKQRGEKSTELQLTLMLKGPEKKDAIISEVNSRVFEIIERIRQQKNGPFG